jgi:hypothetical protein
MLTTTTTTTTTDFSSSSSSSSSNSSNSSNSNGSSTLVKQSLEVPNFNLLALTTATKTATKTATNKVVCCILANPTSTKKTNSNSNNTSNTSSSMMTSKLVEGLQQFTSDEIELEFQFEIFLKEVDFLLSVRLGVLIVWSFEEIEQMYQTIDTTTKFSSSTMNLTTSSHSRLGYLLTIFKNLLIICHFKPPTAKATTREVPLPVSKMIQLLQQKAAKAFSCSLQVFFAFSYDEIIQQMVQKSTEEKKQGYGLFYTSCTSNTSQIREGKTEKKKIGNPLDIYFQERFDFFMSLNDDTRNNKKQIKKQLPIENEKQLKKEIKMVLSYASCLNLSFRFQNFQKNQIPIQKFNEKHWKRMLPWFSTEQIATLLKSIRQILQ